MKFDDSHPDYFVDDGTTPAPDNQHAETAAEADAARTPSATTTISFDRDDTTGTTKAPDQTEVPAKPRRHRLRNFLIWLIAIAVVVLGIAAWFRYFSPCVEDARMRCYVINVEKRGMLFKTYEADVVSEQSLTDTLRIYSRDHSFSVENPEIARQLQNVQGSGRPVEISYVTYSATVPWRGASKSVITSAKIQ